MQHQEEIKIQRRKYLYSPFLFACWFYDFFAWIHFYENNENTARTDKQIDIRANIGTAPPAARLTWIWFLLHEVLAFEELT